MSILTYFDKDVVVRRLRDIDGTKRAISATATCDCHIQSLDPESRQKAGIVDARAWRMWFRIDAEIQEGDVLTDNNGVRYLISEITTKDYGINQHKEVIALEYNA